MDYGLKIVELFLQFGDVKMTHDLVTSLFGDYDDKMCAFRGLVADGLLVLHKGEYYVTDQGREAYARATAQPFGKEPSKLIRFKDEVLTGIIERFCAASGYMVSEPSKVLNAVLPKNKKPTYSSRENVRLEPSRSNREIKYKLMRELSLSSERYEEYLAEGRIRLCTGGGKRHVGIFDRRGEGWQYKCRECRKGVK